MTPFEFGQKIAAHPSLLGGYAHQFNKFYNPWSQAWKEPPKDGIERGLQYAGRAAMGIGGAAAAAAGGIAAAPAIANTATTATMATGGLTAASGANGQKFLDMATRAAPTMSRTINRVGPQVMQKAVSGVNTLNRVNYAPQNFAQDVTNAATGNFDQIAGPGIGPSPPPGLPSMNWRSAANFASSFLPGATTTK